MNNKIDALVQKSFQTNALDSTSAIISSEKNHFFNFRPLEVVSRYRDPQLQVGVGRGPRVVVSTAAFHARVWGSKGTKMFLLHPRVKVSIVGSLCDREVACSTSDRQGSNFVSGGLCHLNHLTILGRFAWPSLAYMCTKVA